MAEEPSDLVVCVDNSGYEAALERRKLYALLPDTDAEMRGLLRIVDESGGVARGVMGALNRAISCRTPSSDATHVRNLVVTDRANRVRRDGHNCQGFTRERSELHLESGARLVHEHDCTDVALLEALGRNVGHQHHQVVFSNCHFCTPRNGYAVMSLGPRSPTSMNQMRRIDAALPVGPKMRPSITYLAPKDVCRTELTSLSAAC